MALWHSRQLPSPRSLLPSHTLRMSQLTPRPQVFLSHLHSDHIADLASLYVGAMFGRVVPWEVWGPSSEIPEVGTAAVIDGLRKVGGGQGGGRSWG